MRIRDVGTNIFERVERGFDGVFGAALNPFHQLGALGWFFFWIVIVSGIYLYIFFDTGITDAYRSVEHITHAQWYAGGVMRSLHRYASDALIIVMMIHLVREYVKDRFRGVRWLAWVTGVPLLWLVYACGISGYWLVWDELAQYIAINTTEWLDSLGIFGGLIARNFLNREHLSGRFFTVMVFVHILVPLIMLFVMWIHIQRNMDPKVNPPRALAAGTLGSMVILSLIYPAVSHPEANLDRVVTTVNPDWFYLPVYPLLDHVSGLGLWFALGLGTAMLLVLPWLPPLKRRPVAEVHLNNCNGCGRCYADCPFNAINIRPRTDGLAFDEQAEVIASHCISCGICVGACPTATPFRRASELVAGIELPDQPVRLLHEQTVAAAERIAGGTGRVIVYGCEHGPDLQTLEGEGVACVTLRCSGMLPPSFVDFVISRNHADGVLLTGCREGDCHHRLGIEWTQGRVTAKRDPHLRARVPQDRLLRRWVGNIGRSGLAPELGAFRERLVALGPYRKPPSSPKPESGHALAHEN